MLGEHCSSACLTRDHNSWGECVRAKNVHDMWLGGTQTSYGREKAFNRTNDNFVKAVNDGLNPAAVSDAAIHAAYDQAEKG